VEPDAVEATLTPGTRDRLDHMDELNQEALEPYVASYQVSRRRLVGGGGLLGLLATIAPASLLTVCSALRGRSTAATPSGRTHVVESTADTVRLGTFDATRPDIIEIDPGDTAVYLVWPKNSGSCWIPGSWDVPMSYTPIVVILSSLEPFFFNGLKKGVCLSDNVKT